MIIHRMSTQAPEPPVRFYKVIALSFLFLTIALLGVVIFITSKKATITVLTKQDNKAVTFSATVGGEKGDHSLAGSVTSTVFVWSTEFQPTGNKQVEDTAKGQVVLYNKTGTTQTLIKTTRLLSSGGVLFRLSEPATIPANGQVTAPVYADQKGATSDIAPTTFTIPGLPADKQKVIYAESTEAMKGGSHTVGILSNDDLTNAKTEYGQKVEEAFLKALSEQGDTGQRAVLVTDSALVADHAVGEEVGSFTLSGTSTIVLVEYRTSDLIDLVNRQAQNSIDAAAERFLSLSKAPTVTVANYDAKANSASLNIRQDVAVTLDSNSEKLSPDHFFGKSKDEIERYIVALDHVAGVEVKFSPSWIMTAPSVADRISVVVKNIR